MKKIAITGIGAVTPLGNTFKECWEAVKAGKSGIGPITKFDASDIPWKIAGEIKGFDAKAYLSQKEINRLDPFIQYAVAASVMAGEDSGLINRSKAGKAPRSKIHDYLSKGAIIIGSSRGGISNIEQSIVKRLHSRFTNQKSKIKNQKFRLSSYLMPSTTISMASSYAAQKLGIKGYCLGISNACASGTNAVGEAYRLLKAGYGGPVLAGGTEAPVCRLCIEGYGVSGALSKTTGPFASRPFNRTRDGFVLSEGACVLMLEDYDTALKRDAKIYGEIIGYGNTTDSFHITKPYPEGEAEVMIMSINQAGIRTDELDYINTHGTATQIGDISEANAIKIAFGKKASKIPATATKSITGHMLAASGAFEAATTILSIKEGIIPPTINLDEKDPACSLNIITKKMHADIRIAISNSFGFGGVNAVLVLKIL